MNRYDIPEAIAEPIPEELKIYDHRHSIVLFDIHSPRHDKELIEYVLKYALLKKIDRLIIGGDSLDMAFFSSFLSRVGYSPDGTEEEMAVSEQLFRELLKVFKDIVWIAGNHDNRWNKVVEEKIGTDRLLRMVLGDEILSKMITTERRYCRLYTPSGEWVITHQIGRGRKRQGSTVEEFASANQVNTMSGHEHYLSHMIERTGKYHAIHGGHCSDENIMEYKQMVLGNYTSWAKGFVELDEYGIPRIWFKKDIATYLNRGE